MTWVLHNLFNNKTKGSSEVWSDKLRRLNNKAHGVTEGRRIIKYKAMIGNRGAWNQEGCLAIGTAHGVTERTEINAMLRRRRGHKE